MAPALLMARPMTTRLVRDLGLALSLVLAACGGKPGNHPDAGSPGDDAPGDAAPGGDAASSFGLTSIFPAAASRMTDTPLTISGFGITGTPAIRITNCDISGTGYDLTPGTTSATSIALSLAGDPARIQGAYTVTVTNGDGMVASLPCALHIVAEPPPTVTAVVPSTAWQGSATDNINSDVNVTIQGTGFQSTPNVRWVSRDNPAVYFDAQSVAFVSGAHITAVVPSETLKMPVGSYDVFVTNPDQLTAQWKIGGPAGSVMAGTFTITGTPPPHITDVSTATNTARIENGTCTSTQFTIKGENFVAGSTAWYLASAGTGCVGSTTDASGNLLCPITVDPTTVTATAIPGKFPVCPALGPYPVVVVNPDGQTAYWFSIEVTPSSDGHLNVGAFETLSSQLEVARWKHAVQFGFDVFSDSLVYVAGGQDAQNHVLGSVEASRFDLFGVPGPFHHLEQYGGAAAPRVANALTVPREGATLVRAGASLFAIGGTTARSDTTTVVPASSIVERAEILGFDQMPTVQLPVAQPQTQGLPMGAWYYRVSAIGPWGESLAAREVVAISKAGQIQVCWHPPSAPGAVSYNIYRSLASDGRAGTATAIAYEVTAADNCWIDTGVGPYAPAPGNARGTLAAGGSALAGTYSYRISAVVPVTGGTRETYAGYASSTALTAADVTAGNQKIALAWDPLPIAGATYRVYRLDPASGTYKLLTGASALTTAAFSDTGVAFDPSGAIPVTEVRPLPPGSLSGWNATTTPQLNAAREGLDGVVVRMDPAASGGLIARILVAGGRDGATGSYVYRTTAESLGIHQDGTTDPAWTNEAPVFAHARGYYALLTTQDRNETPFPPPPTQAPCGDCGGVIERRLAGIGPAPAAPAAPGVAGGEPVYIVAALGDDAFSAANNTGRKDLESCPVDMTTGHLASDCGVAGGTTWVVQTNDDPQNTFGHDAVLYFSFLYPFYGVQSETLGAAGSTIQIVGSAIARFPVFDLAKAVAAQVLDKFQSASTSFVVQRSYYQMTRLLAYVYVVGGFTAAGPTASVERHQQ
jgi:hypothetical protein